MKEAADVRRVSYAKFIIEIVYNKINILKSYKTKGLHKAFLPPRLVLPLNRIVKIVQFWLKNSSGPIKKVLFFL